MLRDVGQRKEIVEWGYFCMSEEAGSLPEDLDLRGGLKVLPQNATTAVITGLCHNMMEGAGGWGLESGRKAPTSSVCKMSGFPGYK